MAGENASTYCGFYINLDRSVARRERMDAQLAGLDLASRYERFAAIDGALLHRPNSALRPGEMGAFLSHMGALEAARAKGRAVHILEDDALLSSHVSLVIEDAIASGLFEQYDVVFTDALIAPHLGMLKGLKSIFDKVAVPKEHSLRLGDFQTIDLAHQNFSCMTSYVVGGRAVDRVLALYRGELENGPSKPVDLFMREMVQSRRLRAALLFPFVTSFRLEDIAASTIAGQPEVPPSVMVLAVLRYLFFVKRDLGLAKSCLDAATRTQTRAAEAHHEMMVQALDFILSDTFQEF
jgi:GR25 family glycosyltransferase involved in LPS biosynthesis